MRLAVTTAGKAGFRLEGDCSFGPMWGSPLFALIAPKRLGKPIPLRPSSCGLLLDPSAMIALGPWKLDHRGCLAKGPGDPMGFLPAAPSLSGLRIFGQFAAVGGDFWNRGVYVSNGTHMQIPYLWSKGTGPAVAVVVASGSGAVSASKGRVRKNYGLVMILSP